MPSTAPSHHHLVVIILTNYTCIQSALQPYIMQNAGRVDINGSTKNYI